MQTGLNNSDLAVELGGVEDDQQDYRVAVETTDGSGAPHLMSIWSVRWDHQARMAIIELGDELDE